MLVTNQSSVDACTEDYEQIISSVYFGELAQPVKDETELSAMDEDALFALLDRVEETLAERSDLVNLTLEAGTYAVGIDIPAGKYTAAGLQAGLATIRINESERSYCMMDETPIGPLSLYQGETLELSYPMLFTTYTGLSLAPEKEAAQ